MTCEQTRNLAGELALGIADGAERAAALEHLAGCAECRRAVAELSDVTDELLLLAPEREPPPRTAPCPPRGGAARRPGPGRACSRIPTPRRRPGRGGRAGRARC